MARCIAFRPAGWQSSVDCRPLISKHVSSSGEEEIDIMSLLSEEEQKKKRKRRFWVHNVCKTRMIHGQFHSLYPDLLEGEAKFFEYFRMIYGEFMTLLNMLGQVAGSCKCSNEASVSIKCGEFLD
jgi:hypothetical protein